MTNTITSAELLKLLRTTKGKAFTTMSGTDLLVEVVKADIMHTLGTVPNDSHVRWWALIKDFGIHFEVENF